MRSSSAVGYNETRDAIARNWYPFLTQVGCERNWILLPNLGDDSVLYLKHWGVEALILTGGDDIGHDESRDNTELSMLRYCIENQLPVLGICRGAQLIYHYFGGTISNIDSQVHRSKRHKITSQGIMPWWPGHYQGNVNSYHSMGLASPLPKELTGFISTGNDCEGIMHKSLNIIGIMWHPERESTISDFDRNLIHWLFS
ncbi:Putative glutamine amidotransferase Rv2859c [Shewanella putrefaciens]|nr:Putative glutamine amidotransferase Rv2859c [Shewanella putrefaciens]